MPPLVGKVKHHCGKLPKNSGNCRLKTTHSQEWCETHNYLCYICDTTTAQTDPYIVGKTQDCNRCKKIELSKKSALKKRKKDDDDDDDKDGPSKRTRAKDIAKPTGIKKTTPVKTKKQLAKENRNRSSSNSGTQSPQTVETLKLARSLRNRVFPLRPQLLLLMIEAVGEVASSEEMAEILRLLGSGNTQGVVEGILGDGGVSVE